MRKTREQTDRPDPSPIHGSSGDPVHVVYLAGIGRSGSTLICRTLGAIPGFVATGELMRVLVRGLLNGDLCSCGSPVPNCSFWRSVRDDLDRRRPGLDYERLERTRHRVTEEWQFLRYLFAPDAELERDLDEYRSFVAALYESIRAVTGARVIVDASKNLLFAKLLTETPGVQVSMLHLVRDSRGVAYSLMRRQERPGTPGRHEHFRRLGPFVGSILWSSANVMAEWTGRRMAGRHVMRYEDFVASPGSAIRALLNRIEGRSGETPLDHVNGHSVRLGVDHLIASNPNRSKRGDIELREDAAWREQMSPGRRWLVTGLTLPLLHRYGYPLRMLPAAPRLAPERAGDGAA